MFGKKSRSEFEYLRTPQFKGKTYAPVTPKPLPKLVYPNTPEADEEARRAKRRKAKAAKPKPTTTKSVPVNVNVTVHVEK